MKLCAVLVASACAQDYVDSYAYYNDDGAGDRWGNVDYYGFNFNFPSGVDGEEFGKEAYLGYGTSTTTGTATTNYDQAAQDHLTHHANGLYCWACDERLDLGTTEEAGTNNAYYQCLANGMLMACKGEQRTCLFEERRRHGVVYSVCTGCKQTDACLALWRRNQRFILPFHNFGDMSLVSYNSNDELADNAGDASRGRPIYVDDECTTYQNTYDSSKWANAAGSDGITSGFSYAKFAVDGSSGDQQVNLQISQFESACRWCCAARPDGICNLDVTPRGNPDVALTFDPNSSPFATVCGPNTGAQRTRDNSTVLDGLFEMSRFLPDGDTLTTKFSSAQIEALMTPGAFGTGTANGAISTWDAADQAAACSNSRAQWATDIKPDEDFRWFEGFSLHFLEVNSADEWTSTSFIHDFINTRLFDAAGVEVSGAPENGAPVSGEGRNSVPMDKYAHRGNQFNPAAPAAETWYHRFLHQTDMLSQENRDSAFDHRVQATNQFKQYVFENEART